MNTLSKQIGIASVVLVTSTLFTTSAKAEQLVSLQTALDMMVANQGRMVANQLEQQLRNSIAQEVNNFKIDAHYVTDKGVPTVTITQISDFDNDNADSDKSKEKAGE
ncbi:hypothetical protein [Thalassotalea mangrovi]|uniref:Uncharacterized protein n=1 Tax=Thalassotalea mangrovi TaxID=2572245 RepID=A0A4V5NU84_9GAMM|nr:hypothetical protein [Thalassotalea mangrovi]TKB45305.1 hypothetical protein E8M12_08870 [Thalassotalea mangrovi]